MATAEPTADCTYEDLVRIYRENSGLETLAVCQRAVKTLRQLSLIKPSEAEFNGERMTANDIEKRITEATAAIGALNVIAGSARTPVIVPADCLR